MSKHKHTAIKSVCFLNSRQIFDWLAEGKTNKDVVARLIAKTEISSAEYFEKGFRAWIRDLGFERHTDLRNHILENGIPEGNKPITKALLAEQTQPKRVEAVQKVETIAEGKPQKVPHETTETEPKEKASLFKKEVNLKAEKTEEEDSGLMPSKNRNVKSLSERVEDKFENDN